LRFVSLGASSRFGTHFYHGPAPGRGLLVYLDFVLAIATEGQWDVLVPMHDQAFSFFRERASFALAVADFTRSSEFRARQCLSDVLTLEGPQ
jgi:hypothetical protein